MALIVNQKKCDGCKECLGICPFAAIDIKDGIPFFNAACKMCGICIKNCPCGAIVKIDEARPEIDKDEWKGVLVFAETNGTALHPVVRELVGKAIVLAAKINHKVYAVIVGENTADAEQELLRYGVEKVFVYDDEAFRYFRVDCFAEAYSDVITKLRPSIVLTGATSIGRSLAPRVAARHRTGLTADCTGLDVKENTDLIQTRPAFGGNIMARIVTPSSRPQFATVRYKVMDAAPLVKPHGQTEHMQVTAAMKKSRIEVLDAECKPVSENISEAEVLVVGGSGLKAKEDLEMVKALAKKLNGQYAVTRPLVEAGWAPQARQIGLSGRTVKPRLIITLGVSGAVQFTAAMKDSEYIFAVNTNAEAPIMNVAHYGLQGDLYEIIPRMLEK